MNTNENEYLDVSDVAQLLCISKNAVYGLIRRRRIPYYKSTKKVLFKKSEVLAFVNVGRNPTRKEILDRVHTDNIKFKKIKDGG